MGADKLEEILARIRADKKGVSAGVKLNEIYFKLSGETREQLRKILADDYEKIEYYDAHHNVPNLKMIGRLDLKEKFGGDKMARYFIAHECALVNGSTLVIDIEGVIELYK